jgi:hypothetical protein
MPAGKLLGLYEINFNCLSTLLFHFQVSLDTELIASQGDEPVRQFCEMLLCYVQHIQLVCKKSATLLLFTLYKCSTLFRNSYFLTFS